jgi:hypothetical protein
MKKEISETRGRIVIALIIFIWLIVTIIFGFVIDKPTSTVGLSMIITFLIFVVCIVGLFLYGRYKKQRLLR